jgi:hypothetical protein
MTLESAAHLLKLEQASRNAGAAQSAQIDASEFWLGTPAPVITNGVNDRHISIPMANREYSRAPLPDAFPKPEQFPKLEAELKAKPSALEHKLLFHDSTAEAYHHASATNKPLVVVFGQKGRYSELVQQELDSMQLGGAAGDAVFLRTNLERDLVGLGIAKRLGITQYPTISILNTQDPGQLNEVARIEGYVPDLKSRLVNYIESVPSKAAT